MFISTVILSSFQADDSLEIFAADESGKRDLVQSGLL